jgi:hypothetical protein
VFVQDGDHVFCRLFWALVAEAACFKLGEDCRSSALPPIITTGLLIEFVPFKLLKRDLGCGRQCVKVEAVRIVLLRELGLCELLLLVIDVRATLWVHSGVIVADHCWCASCVCILLWVSVRGRLSGWSRGTRNATPDA